MKINAEELICNLRQFTGTEKYTRLTKSVVLTDGVVYLAENAMCFWLLDLYASHLVSINHNEEEFTCLNLRKVGSSATVVIDDGNGRVLAEQFVEYTDFPLSEMKLYGCWAGEFWVLMLPSEY